MFLLSIINTAECDNASRGDSSLPEVYNSKEADMLIDGISAELNEDQVSNSRVQQAKLSPADSDNLSEQL